MKDRSTRNTPVGHGKAAASAAALLLLAAGMLPVQAQRLSLSERVTRLEQAQQKQDSGQGGGTVLVNQVQALQSQVQQLQGQVEELQHEIQQLKQSGKDQYVDLDSRLRKLEGGAPAQGAYASSPASTASTAAKAGGVPATSASTTAAAQASGPAPAGSASAPASADPQAAQDAYNQAFTALRNGQFVQSSRQFRQFIQQYPNSTLAPNAFYWLGESYYTVQNYDIALQTFQTLLKQYPDSEKAPGALLKIGYCQDALKQEDAAQKTLQAVIQKYPGSSVANLAQQRLHDIQLQQAN
jgi:tol-pal system protein YbgF